MAKKKSGALNRKKTTKKVTPKKSTPKKPKALGGMQASRRTTKRGCG